MTQSITIEVNLRVPDINIRAGDAPAGRITNSDTRFWKVINVDALPRVGDNLELSTYAYKFPAVVKRLDWVDNKNRFVAACQYGRKSMDATEYESLRHDPDWTIRSLLPSE
jgi:hypothetical protein